MKLTNRTLSMISAVVVISLIGVATVNIIAFLIAWATLATIGLVWMVIRTINEINEYEDVFDVHIEDTERVIEKLSELTNSEVLRYNDEIKQIISFLRSYVQQLINYVNEMRDNDLDE